MNKILDFITGFYIIYIFNYYKTTINFSLVHNNKLQDILGNFKFIIGHSLDNDIYSIKICPLGNIAGFLLGIWILIRNYIGLNNIKIKQYNYIFTIIFLIVSFILNINAFIYLLPAVPFILYN